MTPDEKRAREELLAARVTAFALGGYHALTALWELGEVGPCPKCEGTGGSSQHFGAFASRSSIYLHSTTTPCAVCEGLGRIIRTADRHLDYGFRPYLQRTPAGMR